MLQRLVLLAASAAAALALATGLALAGFGPPAAVAEGQPVDQVTEAPAATLDAAAPMEAIQVDTVYVQPAPSPDVVVTRLVREATTARHDDDDDGGYEHEGEDD
jgi:hypothetical protein